MYSIFKSECRSKGSLAVKFPMYEVLSSQAERSIRSSSSSCSSGSTSSRSSSSSSSSTGSGSSSSSFFLSYLCYPVFPFPSWIWGFFFLFLVCVKYTLSLSLSLYALIFKLRIFHICFLNDFLKCASILEMVLFCFVLFCFSQLYSFYCIKTRFYSMYGISYWYYISLSFARTILFIETYCKFNAWNLKIKCTLRIMQILL